MKKVIATLLIASLFSGCVKVPTIFGNKTFVVHQGYLSIGKINQNIAKQMPLIEKVGSNEVKIVSANVYGDTKSNNLLIEADFIFTSFQIPEGLPAIAKLSANLIYEPQTREFRFKNVVLNRIDFLKEELVEYISKPQQKFIEDAIAIKISELILHKSKKRLNPIKNYKVENSKIKIIFK